MCGRNYGYRVTALEHGRRFLQTLQSKPDNLEFPPDYPYCQPLLSGVDEPVAKVLTRFCEVQKFKDSVKENST